MTPYRLEIVELFFSDFDEGSFEEKTGFGEVLTPFFRGFLPVTFCSLILEKSVYYICKLTTKIPQGELK